MNNLKDKLVSLKREIELKNQAWEDINSSLFVAQGERIKFEKSLYFDTRAQAVVQSLYERLNEGGLNEICKLMSGGLNETFPDRKYEVRFEISFERGANCLNFYLYETLDNGKVIKSNIRNSTGGSIRALCGLIGVLSYIIKLKAKRFIVIDEGLTEIEDAVVDNVFSMLKSFGKQAGFSFIMTSHDVRFTPYADRLYRVEKGKIKLVEGGSE